MSGTSCRKDAYVHRMLVMCCSDRSCNATETVRRNRTDKTTHARHDSSRGGGGERRMIPKRGLKLLKLSEAPSILSGLLPCVAVEAGDLGSCRSGGVNVKQSCYTCAPSRLLSRVRRSKHTA